MPRTRTIPDDHIFATIQRLLAEGGEKAVSFASVATSTGLAPPTLVQRYGTRDEMVRLARLAAWNRLDAGTSLAIVATAGKGPQALLKSLTPYASVELVAASREASLALRAKAWRTTVETALAERLGSGQRGRESAAILFDAWQGQMLWAHADAPGFKIKDAVKRLT